jgi:hypothetical protein
MNHDDEPLRGDDGPIGNVGPYLVDHPGGPSLFPRWTGHPYFIVAPDYTRFSAGVKALHVFCHSLNSLGLRAFVVASKASPDLNTPLLTPVIVDEYQARGIAPIAVYTETVSGNPMNAANRVRYLLNYASYWQEDVRFLADEFVVSYGEGMREDGGEEFVLHIPVADTSCFYPPSSADAPRSGRCVYAAKYTDYFGEELLPLTEGMQLITRWRHDSPTPRQLGELFRRSEALYCYENSTLALEAVLCGCPVLWVRNAHFTEVIAHAENKNYGTAWADEPDALARARETLPLARENYAALARRYWTSLAEFVRRTQAAAASTPQVQPLEFPRPFPRGRMISPLMGAYTIAKVVQRRGAPAVAAALRDAATSGAPLRSLGRALRREYFHLREDMFREL